MRRNAVSSMETRLSVCGTDPLPFDFVSWNPNIKYITIPNEIGILFANMNSYLLLTIDEMIDEDDCNHITCEDKIFQEFIENNNESLSPFLIEVDQMLANFNGAFIKMHRSPKDALWYNNDSLECKSSFDIVKLLVKSERIASDIQDYISRNYPLLLYFQQFSAPNIENEYRIFVHEKRIIGISSCFGNDKNTNINEISEKVLNRLYSEYNIRLVTFCIDIEIIGDTARIFEINPLDAETDLFSYSPEDLIRASLY